MEVRRFARGNDMIAKLNIFRRFAIRIFTFEQVAHPFFTRCVSQNFIAGIIVFTGCNVIVAMEFYNAIFNADRLNIRHVSFAIIRFNILKRFLRVFLRLLPEDRVQLAADQIRIDGLPHTIPVGERAIAYISVIKHARCRFLLNLRHRRAMSMMTMREGRTIYQQHSQKHCQFF
ncbi:Uncharacterised protein [Salmonella enterica subsp. enterica serovar Bovismorbificans]|nr:Uncharacterised protein [Salmonella enterica subsp. enterica serovar Bovismorbificans]